MKNVKAAVGVLVSMELTVQGDETQEQLRQMAEKQMVDLRFKLHEVFRVHVTSLQ